MSRSRRPATLVFLLVAALFSAPLSARESERLYLSGTGLGDEVDWEFSVTDGRRAGEWTTIPVPSQWELHGFGTYNYGHDEDKSREEGLYRHRFRVPESFRGRTVELVFEGVMTDATVRLNGQSAGPTHHGAFYPFRYDVTELLDLEGENVLEVDVAKHSAEPSVNRAERDADYWIFGGIFRPVWLAAHPPESIRTVAVDARHDGSLRLEVTPRHLDAPARIHARVETLDGESVGEALAAELPAGETVVLDGKVPGVLTWNAEDPRLYRLVVELLRGEEVLHRHRERIGFRTMELRPEGLFVNDRRVLLKGVNRHAFWPDSGRTLNAALDRRDAELLKRMNLNAVRMSHYPPDRSFLAAADELGLYVIDELAGWHDAYATDVGRPLVRAMVERDRNHPSILFWANGNEDGWNERLDDDFALHDPQDRPVLHPRSKIEHDGLTVDTFHYPNWDELLDGLTGGFARRLWSRFSDRPSPFGPPPLYMPTEFLHGLYDGGAGAGLEDYWSRLRTAENSLGGFLWALTDESVVRTDRGGALDSDGNHAPDGVLGPYRELSASYYSLRAVFSPVALAGFQAEAEGVRLVLENRFDHTDLADVRFRYTWLALPASGDDGEIIALSSGEVAGPAAPPGGHGELVLPPRPEMPPDGLPALRLELFDRFGRSLCVWSSPIFRRSHFTRHLTAGSGEVEAEERAGELWLRAGGTEARFDLATGHLVELARDGSRLRLDGPVPASGTAGVLVALRHFRDGDRYVVEASFNGSLERSRFELHPSGWLRLSVQLEGGEPADVSSRSPGFGFPIADRDVEAFEWLGEGPVRIWGNRRHGGTLGLWRKDRNRETPPGAGHEPKLAGFYTNVLWARVQIAGKRLDVALPPPASDLGVGIAKFPDDAKDAVARVPSLGLTFLPRAPAIGTKFHPADELGPQGGTRFVPGLAIEVWLRVVASPR